MGDVTDLRNSTGWNVAVWGLRVIGPGLGVVVAGLIALAWSTATGKALLAIGMAVYVVGVVITIVEVRRAYGALQPPRPACPIVQRTLVHDAMHSRS